MGLDESMFYVICVDHLNILFSLSEQECHNIHVIIRHGIFSSEAQKERGRERIFLSECLCEPISCATRQHLLCLDLLSQKNASTTGEKIIVITIMTKKNFI